ncbi:hypothetical protein V3C99_009874 [Haemonchus contortus]
MGYNIGVDLLASWTYLRPQEGDHPENRFWGPSDKPVPIEPSIVRYTTNYNNILHMRALNHHDGLYRCELYRVLEDCKELLGVQTTFISHTTSKDRYCPVAFLIENNSAYTRMCHCDDCLPEPHEFWGALSDHVSFGASSYPIPFTENHRAHAKTNQYYFVTHNLPNNALTVFGSHGIRYVQLSKTSSNLPVFEPTVIYRTMVGELCGDCLRVLFGPFPECSERNDIAFKIRVTNTRDGSSLEKIFYPDEWYSCAHMHSPIQCDVKEKCIAVHFGSIEKYVKYRFTLGYVLVNNMTEKELIVKYDTFFGKPYPPPIFTMRSDIVNAIDMSWESTYQDFEHFIVHFTSGEEEKHEGEFITKTPSFFRNGLLPTKHYTVWIRTKGKDGRHSSMIAIRTRPISNPFSATPHQQYLQNLIEAEGRLREEKNFHEDELRRKTIQLDGRLKLLKQQRTKLKARLKSYRTIKHTFYQTYIDDGDAVTEIFIILLSAVIILALTPMFIGTHKTSLTTTTAQRGSSKLQNPPKSS